METRAVVLINHVYEPETSIKEREAALYDGAHVKKMFKHTVFKENIKYLIDKSKKDIEDYFEKELYPDIKKEAY